MITIRRMQVDDADAVRGVDAAAFEAWLKRARGRKDELPRRTRTNVLALREHDPDGCFVAQDQDHIVGFIFSRTWGSVGWFGTFGVLPRHQGRGTGKQLIAASLDYLQRQPDRVIGLETMPDSPYNLGLYLGFGFRVRFLTLQLVKALDPPARGLAALRRWPALGAAARQRALSDLREVTHQILPGLDYTKEIISTARHDLGETVILTEGAQAVGASTVRLAPLRENKHQDIAVAQPVVLHPAHTTADAFHRLLAAGESLACEHGKRRIVVPVNARHAWALDQALAAGYRVRAASVRMVLAGTDDGPCTDRHVNLARWAG